MNSKDITALAEWHDQIAEQCEHGLYTDYEAEQHRKTAALLREHADMCTALDDLNDYNAELERQVEAMPALIAEHRWAVAMELEDTEGANYDQWRHALETAQAALKAAGVSDD